MIRQLLAIALLAPQVPAPQLAGTWQMQSYSREHTAVGRDGRPSTEVVSLDFALGQRLSISVADDVVIVITRFGTRQPIAPIPSTSTDRYDVDGQAHAYEWGDVREVGTRTSRAIDSGFAVSQRPRSDDLAQEYRFSLSPDAQQLTIDVSYPPTSAPAWAQSPIRDVRVFTREP